MFPILALSSVCAVLAFEAIVITEPARDEAEEIGGSAEEKEEGGKG